MKYIKIISLILISIIIVGCGRDLSNITSKTSYKINETAKIDKLEITLTNFKYLDNDIVEFTFKITNNRDNSITLNSDNNFKIYRPLADKYTKWRNNLTPYDIQGYEQLPKKGDLLIITKSMKDVMCLYEMGYTAISPASESTFLTPDVIDALKLRFKRILICFDRDVPGVKNMRKISLKTGLNGFLVHKKFKSKDISDAVKNNGFDIVKNWLKETL